MGTSRATKRSVRSVGGPSVGNFLPGDLAYPYILLSSTSIRQVEHHRHHLLPRAEGGGLADLEAKGGGALVLRGGVHCWCCCGMPGGVAHEAAETGDDPQPPQLKMDNMSGILLSKNPVLHDQSKHIDTKYHYIHECTECLAGLRELKAAAR